MKLPRVITHVDWVRIRRAYLRHTSGGARGGGDGTGGSEGGKRLLISLKKTCCYCQLESVPRAGAAAAAGDTITMSSEDVGKGRKTCDCSKDDVLFVEYNGVELRPVDSQITITRRLSRTYGIYGGAVPEQP